MKGKIARSIAAVAVGSLLAVVSGGVAAASVLDNGKGSSSTEAAGAQVLELRDELTKVAYAGDVQATQRALDDLDPLLTDISAGQRYEIQADAMETAGTAQQWRTETSDALSGKAQPRQVPPVPGLPELPDPLSMITGLLQSLLTLLTDLLGGLLGGGVPELPVPEVPAP
ncbi:hypothetical protein [Amycolatopsis cihanbeyliensis]|uniref:Uncharacterized protein n=1 Tax=Amycolatopsis cihanbeyliensis TaxID=1128664 RepID=A0A542DMV4_AMYCI|nr:hypothetical protein [Amycolatopsis cihanbeyliensis]TQJ04416.1 hypothetical protein FB471_4209 [Amycolatopsis cihanbeyliensis]